MSAIAAPTVTSKIVRIILVRDTREYEEGPDGKFRPIPGSGSEHECARCGAIHEVHAEVELLDGSRQVVGTGCAARESMGVATKIRTAEAKAKRLARLRAELASLRIKIASQAAIIVEVEALPLPEIEEGKKQLNSGKVVPVLCMGNAEVRLQHVRGPADLAERRETLVSHWRDRRLMERGYGSRAVRLLREGLKRVEMAITKLGE